MQLRGRVGRVDVGWKLLLRGAQISLRPQHRQQLWLRQAKLVVGMRQQLRRQLQPRQRQVMVVLVLLPLQLLHQQAKLMVMMEELRQVR
jgi:hypothetical protein